MGIEVEEIEIEPWTETVLGHPGLGAIGENKYDDWGLSSLVIVLKLHCVYFDWYKTISWSNKSRSLKRCVMLQNPSPIAIWFCFHYVRITCTIPGKKNGMEASFYPEFTRPPPTKLFTGPQLGSPLAPAPRCIKGLDLLRCCTNNLVSSASP